MQILRLFSRELQIYITLTGFKRKILIWQNFINANILTVRISLLMVNLSNTSDFLKKGISPYIYQYSYVHITKTTIVITRTLLKRKSNIVYFPYHKIWKIYIFFLHNVQLWACTRMQLYKDWNSDTQVVHAYAWQNWENNNKKKKKTHRELQRYCQVTQNLSMRIFSVLNF